MDSREKLSYGHLSIHTISIEMCFPFKNDFVTGVTEFEEEQLEAAISGVIFQTIEKVQTVGDAAHEVSFNFFKFYSVFYSMHMIFQDNQLLHFDLTCCFYLSFTYFPFKKRNLYME